MASPCANRMGLRYQRSRTYLASLRILFLERVSFRLTNLRNLVTNRLVSDVTRLLGAIDQGDPKAAAELLPLVYDELRRLATARMAKEAPGQTLQPTALVHEAWLRLGADAQPGWQNRAHFFGAAAEAMRRILVERARR